MLKLEGHVYYLKNLQYILQTIFGAQLGPKQLKYIIFQ
jgi:hypothetical protein